MLGWLHVIDECLEQYEDHSKQIFVPQLRPYAGLKWINAEVGKSWNDEKDLVNQVKNFLRAQKAKEDVAFLQTRE